MQIVNQAFDEWPQIKLAPYHFYPDFSLEVHVFLEHLADQPLEMPHVATQGLQHLGRCSITGASFGERQFQDPPSERDRIQRSSEIMCHKGEIIFPAPLHLQR